MNEKELKQSIKIIFNEETKKFNKALKCQNCHLSNNCNKEKLFQQYVDTMHGRLNTFYKVNVNQISSYALYERLKYLTYKLKYLPTYAVGILSGILTGVFTGLIIPGFYSSVNSNSIFNVIYLFFFIVLLLILTCNYLSEFKIFHNSNSDKLLYQYEVSIIKQILIDRQFNTNILPE